MNKQQFGKSRRSDSFNSITLGLLSPEQILERSFGEVRRTYYEPNPMLVRERQTELPKKRVEK